MQFIFDTNAYRNLVHGLTLREAIELGKSLKKNEEATGFSSASSTVVIMELIQHLLDGDPAKEDCYKALCMQLHHTGSLKDGTMRGFFYPPLKVILAQIFFSENSKYMELYNKVISLYLELTNKEDINSWTENKKDIEIVKAQILFEKDEIKMNFENFLASLNNEKVDWTYFAKNKKERKDFFEKIANGDMAVMLAMSFMQLAYQVMNIEELQPNAEAELKIFIMDYRAAILMNLNLLKLIGNGVEKLQDVNDVRWNTINDVQIIFAMLYNKGKEMKVLITEEKKIKESAEEAGLKNRVLTLDEYKALIKFNG